MQETFHPPHSMTQGLGAIGHARPWSSCDGLVNGMYQEQTDEGGY